MRRILEMSKRQLINLMKLQHRNEHIFVAHENRCHVVLETTNKTRARSALNKKNPIIKTTCVRYKYL